MSVLRFYQAPALSQQKTRQILEQLQATVETVQLVKLQTEYCYYIELSKGDIKPDERTKLIWILSPELDRSSAVREKSCLANRSDSLLIEIGPRLNFSTAFSTNAVSICHAVGLTNVTRIERSVRYHVTLNLGAKAWKCQELPETERQLVEILHDRMTECQYLKPIESFKLPIDPESWLEVDILSRGKKALQDVSVKLGLAFDDWDLQYYTDLFRDKIQRNPTTVECFDLAQSNSEHSRHWFFKGRMIIDGKEEQKSLLKMIFETQDSSNQNNVIKFCDNSSAIRGYDIEAFVPKDPSKASHFVAVPSERHIIFTAETHNFPTGVAPFSGATTGTGGRIRDVHAAGRGAHVVAGTAGYSFGNLLIPGYNLPWEDKNFDYPWNFARPVEVAVEASNGASDYGNKFGEPVLSGFARSFGMRLASGERREWIKPIMFSGGIGSIESNMVQKTTAEKGMLVVKIGGPVYRIGVGGGAASSVHVQGDQAAELDFGAVQRGDAEMEQKLNRVVRGCIEMGPDNPICSIHDQGAGGNGNVLKEIIDPAGAVIYTSCFQLGDPTISTLELWGAEYQESDAILIRSKDKIAVQKLAVREKCPVSFVGIVTGNGRIVLQETDASQVEQRPPVDLDLGFVLGSMPNKVFHLERHQPSLRPLTLPEDLAVQVALSRVLRLPSVASKRYLTNKVDRCVTGLVAQQQCVGPLHTPLADVAVVALSFFNKEGSATAIGEQPVKGLLDPAAGARMSVAEAVTNLAFARITSLQDVKCSGNWMWAAKLPGEGAALYDACRAMCDAMAALGIAVDGGKDSLSMAARVGQETVKAPGTLVVSTYAPCPDITATVTPDLKCPGDRGYLVWVDVSKGRARLGGSALAQCFNQLGYTAPDLDDPKMLRSAFAVTQELLENGCIAAGHDISDGGLITCILEMAFAGNCGVAVDVTTSHPTLQYLFAEEIGWILEVDATNLSAVTEAYRARGIPCTVIGHSGPFGPTSEVNIKVNKLVLVRDTVAALRDIWEETSYHLELRQANPDCVREERSGLFIRTAPPYRITFDVGTPLFSSLPGPQPRVAVVREEGSNGDREMAAALFMAGFEVWDVTMTDLQSGEVYLDHFRGVIFPGGFSYADVLGSARGWAASLLFHPHLKSQLLAFSQKPHTFSLGVCNGCQLLALLGWVAPSTDENGEKTNGAMLKHNLSERFESRFVTVRIEPSPAIMLRGMEGSVLGVWSAHAEGRFVFRNELLQSTLKAHNLMPLLYVDDDGRPTMEYPMNPNGSTGGLAGLCSADGRHLAMMPHPERSVMPWQWAYVPYAWKDTMKVSPWQRMFQNAYKWCLEHPA